ncbi:MAG: hypothetical protein E7273_00075 [Pseudobutyrivibrio ruminis]|nr:hypothetical protein [Pseudobutyrivibrio ruminis]
MKTDFDYKVDLKLKNILIVMPQFYAYQTKIHDDLIARGANVMFYDEEPEKTKYLVLKKLEKIFKKKNIFEKFNKQLTEQIIAQMPAGGYDYFLLIRGNIISEETVNTIKEKALKSGAKTVYYAWDSFENMRHGGQLGKLFDYRATFDSVDAKNDPSYELLPLFYSDDFDGAKLVPPAEYKYDYVSVSAFFPFRYRYFKAFKEANPDKKLCLKIYLPPSVYRGKKFSNPKEVKNLDMDIISFEPFSPEDIRNMCLHSKAVLDLAHEKQQGLTMRTMETLGIRRKLVTNNIYLKDYEFYNPDNALILEDLATKADEAEASGDYSAFTLPDANWLDKPYVEDERIRKRYSIHAWLDKLLG